MPSGWDPDRLTDRFGSIDENLRDLREQVRTFAPTSVQIGVAEAKIEDIEGDVADLKASFAEINKAMTNLLRSSRADTIRIGGLLILPLILLIIAGLVSGRLG